MNEKLDKIIDLLAVQNNLLAAIATSLNAKPLPSKSSNYHNTQLNDIRSEIEKKIQEAKKDAKAKFAELQSKTNIIDTILE